MAKTLSRRRILQMGALLTAALPATGLAATCIRPTPNQDEGPFYPIKDQPDKDNDLTLVKGKSEIAKGQKVFVHGVVTDQECIAVPGVMVEIWQACETGRYDHVNDPNTADLDENFQYWGKAVTDADGRYEFLTIIPGQYPAGSDWIRPSHIHYKIHKRGYLELITQMYFNNDPYNSSDLILSRLPEEDQKSVIIDFKDSLVESKDQLVAAGTILPVGRFDLRIVSLTKPFLANSPSA